MLGCLHGAGREFPPVFLSYFVRAWLGVFQEFFALPWIKFSEFLSPSRRNCILTAVIGPMLVTRFRGSVKRKQCIKRNLLETQASIIIFWLIYKDSHIGYSDDILDQSTVPVMGWLLGYIDEIVLSKVLGSHISLFRAMCFAGIEALCGPVRNAMVLGRSQPLVKREINRGHWRLSTTQWFSFADRNDRKAMSINGAKLFVVSRIATTGKQLWKMVKFRGSQRPEMSCTDI